MAGWDLMLDQNQENYLVVCFNLSYINLSYINIAKIFVNFIEFNLQNLLKEQKQLYGMVQLVFLNLKILVKVLKV